MHASVTRAAMIDVSVPRFPSKPVRTPSHSCRGSRRSLTPCQPMRRDTNPLADVRLKGYTCRSTSPGLTETATGDGGGGGKGSDKFTGGDGSSDDSSGSMSPALTAILVEAGRKVESFPHDFATALLSGKVSEAILRRYLSMERNIIYGLLFRIAGFRQRLLADPGFMYKVAIECGIGIGTKSAAEYTKRGEGFWNELDFVSANVIMAILADFMLVWLPAPTLVYNRSATQGMFPWFNTCPDNAFQVVQKGTMPFSLAQRIGSVVRNGTKLLGVGVVCSFIGVASTNGLVYLRSKLDPTFNPQNPPQNILAMALGYGVYMATSSNLRYQMVAGIIEERGIEVVFHNQRQISTALSFIVRTANTFIGSLLWVDFCRLTGLQKKTASQPVLEEAPAGPISKKSPKP